MTVDEILELVFKSNLVCILVAYLISARLTFSLLGGTMNCRTSAWFILTPTVRQDDLISNAIFVRAVNTSSPALRMQMSS